MYKDKHPSVRITEAAYLRLEAKVKELKAIGIPASLTSVASGALLSLSLESDPCKDKGEDESIDGTL